MQPVSARGLIFASQQKDPQLWAANIKIFSEAPADAKNIKAFVSLIGNLSESDKNSVTDYLAKKEPGKLNRLFDKILQGKMLDADAKLSRVSKELKKVKQKNAILEDRFPLIMEMTKLQTAYQIEMATPIKSVYPPNPGVAICDSIRELALQQQREEQFKPFLNTYNQSMRQLNQVRSEAQALLARIERDITSVDLPVAQLIPAIKNILVQLAGARKENQDLLSQLAEKGATILS